MFFAVNQMLDFVCEFFCCYNHFSGKGFPSVQYWAFPSCRPQSPFTLWKLFFFCFPLFVFFLSFFLLFLFLFCFVLFFGGEGVGGEVDKTLLPETEVRIAGLSFQTAEKPWELADIA